MVKNVFYLVKSSSKNGYVLPDEEDMSDPSQASSACLAFDPDFDKCYIKAVDNGSVNRIELRRVKPEKNLYSADTRYGTVYFRAKTGQVKYVGKKLSNSIRLKWLDPVSTVELERLCCEHRFFFVGETKS